MNIKKTQMKKGLIVLLILSYLLAIFPLSPIEELSPISAQACGDGFSIASAYANHIGKHDYYLDSGDSYFTNGYSSKNLIYGSYPGAALETGSSSSGNDYYKFCAPGTVGKIWRSGSYQNTKCYIIYCLPDTYQVTSIHPCY